MLSQYAFPPNMPHSMYNILLCTMLMCMLAVNMQIAASAPSLTEAQALLAFKSGISKDPFGRLESWHVSSNDSSPCKELGQGGQVAVAWAGIVCNSQTRQVITVNLRGFNLSGSISSSLSFLPALSRLDLSDNLLYGNLSNTLFLPHSPLRYLNLSYNSLGGELPRSLANLSALRMLDLSDNKFVGILPASLGQLGNLKVLMLEETGLSADIPKEIWQLSGLRKLWITDDTYSLLNITLPDSFGFCSTITELVLQGSSAYRGSAIPSSLSDCHKLEFLWIDVSGLQGFIPPQVWQLPLLQVVVVWDESFGSLGGVLPYNFAACHTISQLQLGGFNATGSSIPSSLGVCQGLEVLVFDIIGLQGSIPPQIWQLPSLQTLIVVDQEAAAGNSGNMQFKLQGSLPPNFSFCPSIEVLAIDGVNLTGEIPSSLGQCTSLQILDLSHDNFQGFIPNSLKNLTNLQELELEGNNLTGGIPASLSACSQLERLRLGDNEHLYGTIPRELGELTQLKHLSLFTVSLSGPMPEELCNCTQLIWLDVGWARVGDGMGKLPDCIARLAQLQTLGWQFNAIKGEVPMKVLKNLTQLQYLDMSFASVRGGIPQELGNLSQLRHLGFRSNSLTGSIPAAIGMLPSIDQIDLSINYLSGSIPEAFFHGLGDGSSITQLSVSQNHLQGVIPNSIGSLQKLQVLYMSANNFSGTIPSTLGNCTSLQDLDVSSNLLTGAIPWTLGQLTGLSHNLLLSSNNLSGKIPDELGALAELQVLDLSKNNLLGPLPKSLENCSSLQILRLSRNNLTGKIKHFNLSKLPRLQTFTVQQNNFAGGLPRGFTDSPNLLLFDVQRNMLSGSFDSNTAEITGLSKLKVLVMSYNNLSGKLPGWLWKLPMLQVLDLSNNRFSGIMPTTVMNLAYFKQDQSQSKNQSTLYEEVPQTIKFTFQVLSYILSNRIFFDVSMNHLEGEIAESFGELLGLTGLNLSHNRIGGGIPASLGKLVNLDVLDLSHNNLTGGIPQELGNIGGLSLIDLSYNNLQGGIPTTNFFNTRFNNGSFLHNPLLCGEPLIKNCSTGQQAAHSNATNLGAEPAAVKSLARRVVERISEFASPWGLLVGYAIGFLGVLYLLHHI